MNKDAEKALTHLIGEVMRRKPAADPVVVRRMLLERIRVL